MKLIRITLCTLYALFFVSSAALAQTSSQMRPRDVPTKPAGTCSERDFIQARDTHIASLCQSGTWKDVSTGAGAGYAGVTTGGTGALVFAQGTLAASNPFINTRPPGTMRR